MPVTATADVASLAPLGIVVATALAVLVLDLFLSDDLRPHAALALVGLAAAAFVTLRIWGTLPEGRAAPGSGVVAVDRFAVYTWLVILLATAGTLLSSLRFARWRGLLRGEYVILVLLATAGMMLLAAANDLVLLFLALETFSIALYVLTGFRHRERRSQEAAFKYFVLGSVAAALLLYGTALLFADTGETRLTALHGALQPVAPPGSKTAVAVALGALTRVVPGAEVPVGLSTLAGAGMLLVLAALAFKVAIVPFHQWTPDVYTGAPAPVTGFMSAATKAAAFAALIRVLWMGFPAGLWLPVLAVLAVLTMLAGNLIALVQSNMKRMLGYSAVAQAGYLLVAVVAGPPKGTMAALFYVLVYGLANVGAFAVIAALGPQGEEGREAEELDDFRGLGRRQPALALAFALFMLSLTGLPPTAGFLGKWYIYQSAVGAGVAWLGVVLGVASAISAFTYLRPVAYMFMAAPDEAAAPEVSSSEAVAIGVPALVLAVALFVGGALAFGAQSAGYLTPPAAAADADGGGQPLLFAAPAFDKRPAAATAAPSAAAGTAPPSARAATISVATVPVGGDSPAPTSAGTVPAATQAP